jgi:hypothetical protein
MKPYGDIRPEFPIPVINEREARAGAGILLVLGLIAFQNTFTTGDFGLTRLAIVGFGIDFFIRVFISHRFAPSLILGRAMVARQVPEYVGAAQKRFAWALGLVIALIMGVWVIGLGQAGPVALLGCAICILLLMFESAFGICLGCKIYNWVYDDPAQMCPGGVCEVGPHTSARRLPLPQGAALAGFVVVMAVLAPMISALQNPVMGRHAQVDAQVDAQGEAKDCTPPAFARAIGHEEMWKLHNGCS